MTSESMAEMRYRHPWLYHVVWRSDECARGTVASDGLVAGELRHRWHPLFAPRPGHVYLATHSYLDEASSWIWSAQRTDDLYAVDTSHLVASRVNPDEDHFTASRSNACDPFHLQPAAGMDLWKMFGSAVVPSFGDWADQIGLGSDPAHAVHSLSGGSVAYAGVVPPKALLRWDEDAAEWLRLEQRCAVSP